MRDSGTGPDGLPYSRWKANKKLAAVILWRLLCEACNFGLCPFGFHDLLKVFVPKTVEPNSPAVVDVQASETRPLGSKNSDCKIVSASVLQVVAPVAAQFCCEIQTGFVKGRDFV
eukprot:10484510-Karenia_brevis.AAC.1